MPSPLKAHKHTAMSAYMLAKNPYQGSTLKVLFVCSAGILRSATAAWWAAKYKDWNVRNAGTYTEALVPLSPQLVHWADRIYFMNSHNYHMALSDKLVDDGDERVVVLNIPDNYEYRNPKLVELIAEALKDE